MRRDPLLSEFYPVVFPEESYEVATVGEFWLECLNHLAEQAPEDERANLRLSYSDLSTTQDDRDLGGTLPRNHSGLCGPSFQAFAALG